MDDLLKEMAPFDGKTPEERARRRRLVATAAICGLGFVGIGQLATGALFEDSATAAVSNASGNVSIQANGSAATLLPDATNLAPGDSAFRAITVHNSGSLDLRYAISGITTSDPKSLSTQLRYAVYSGVGSFACAAGNVAGGTLLKGNVVIGMTTTPVVGSNVTGQDPGDRTLLTAGADDTLCVETALPLSATSLYASATAKVMLTFDAEQTKNN